MIRIIFLKQKVKIYSKNENIETNWPAADWAESDKFIKWGGKNK